MIIENKLKPFSLLESSQYIEPDFNLYLMVEEYDNGNLVYLDNIKTICEEYNHTYEEINEYLNEEYDNNCYTVIDEEDIIKDPEIVNIFENYIVRELPDSDIVSQYTEYLVDKYIDTFDESYLDFIYEPCLLLESRDKELDLYRSMARILRGKVGKINPELGTKFRQFHYNGSRNDLISIKSDIKNLMNKDSNFSKAVEKAIIKAPTAEYRVGRLSANDQHDEYGKYTSTTNTGDKVSSFNPELTNFKDFRVLRNIAIDLGFENKMKKDEDGDFEDDFGEDLDNLRDVLVRKGRRTKDNNDKDYLIDRRSTATKSNRIFTQDPENVGKSYRDIIDDLLDKGKIKSAEMVLNKYKNLVNASSSRLKDVNDDVVDQKSKKNISDVIDYFYNKTKNKIESSKKKQTPNSGGKTINSSSIESLEQEQKNKPIIDKNQFDKSAQDKFSKSMLFRQLIQDRTQHTTSQSSTKGFTDEDTLNKLNNYFNKNNIGNSEEEKSRYTKEAIALLNKRMVPINKIIRNIDNYNSSKGGVKNKNYRRYQQYNNNNSINSRIINKGVLNALLNASDEELNKLSKQKIGDNNSDLDKIILKYNPNFKFNTGDEEDRIISRISSKMSSLDSDTKHKISRKYGTVEDLEKLSLNDLQNLEKDLSNVKVVRVNKTGQSIKTTQQPPSSSSTQQQPESKPGVNQGGATVDNSKKTTQQQQIPPTSTQKQSDAQQQPNTKPGVNQGGTTVDNSKKTTQQQSTPSSTSTSQQNSSSSSTQQQPETKPGANQGGATVDTKKTAPEVDVQDLVQTIQGPVNVNKNQNTFIQTQNKETEKLNNMLKPDDIEKPGFITKLARTVLNKPRDFIAKMAVKLRHLYKKWLAKARIERDQGKAGFFKKIALKLLQAVDWLMKKLSKIKSSGYGQKVSDKYYGYQGKVARLKQFGTNK